MDSIKTALFEEPFYIYVGLAFAELVLLGIWYERRTRRWALALLVPVLLAPMVFVVEAVVETDREQITRALNEIADDVEDGSTAAGAGYLDDEYRGFGGSKEQIISRVENVTNRFDIESIRFVNLKVEVENSTARTTFSSVVNLSSSGGGTSLVWDIRWVKRADGWRIIAMEQPRMGLEI